MACSASKRGHGRLMMAARCDACVASGSLNLAAGVEPPTPGQWRAFVEIAAGRKDWQRGPRALQETDPDSVMRLLEEESISDLTIITCIFDGLPVEFLRAAMAAHTTSTWPQFRQQAHVDEVILAEIDEREETDRRRLLKEAA